MCRPSCCKPSHDGSGIAAVAVIAAVFVATKIGPAAARIWHIAVEALTIFMLTCASAAAVILVTWATARFISTRRARRHAVLRTVPSDADRNTGLSGSALGCVACGGTRTVLRAITASDYRAGPCPVCDPAERAG